MEELRVGFLLGFWLLVLTMAVPVTALVLALIFTRLFRSGQ
jgi:hypothetical protein